MNPAERARRELVRHPQSPSAAAARVEADIRRDGGGSFSLRFRVIGAPGEIRLPETAAPVFADELWRTTCFEAFVTPAGDSGYYEFNFSPSGAWAVYRFGGYRAGMTPLPQLADPLSSIEARADELIFAVAARLDWSGNVAGALDWRVGLSAILEDQRGLKSYWALAHPGGPPDFHHPDCFALRLASEGGP